MCRKNLCKKSLLSRKRQNRNVAKRRYANKISPSEIGERPTPILTGNAAVSFFMKAVKVEESINRETAFVNPRELSALKKYADRVAAMEEESKKIKLK